MSSTVGDGNRQKHEGAIPHPNPLRYSPCTLDGKFVMAFHDLERKKIENVLNAFIETIRPASHIRSELDFGFDISGQSIELVEIRPQWGNKSIIRRHAFAKATFVNTQGVWKVYWLRASGKWKSYEPASTASSVEDFLAIVKADVYGCFFG